MIYNARRAIEFLTQWSTGNGMSLLKVSNLTKSYGGVHALNSVGFEVAFGEIHAICGENGAGKSTLMKCLTGTVQPDEGIVSFNDRRLISGNVQASEAAGIAVLHQESTAFPDLNAIDNIFVGREYKKWNGWGLDKKRMREESVALLNRLGQSIRLDCPIGKLPVANRQMVSIARALSQECKLLIMDEPTASLSARETDSLLEIVNRLRDDGVSILYVSHRLEEIFAIADRVTVLRDGERTDTCETKSLDRNKLVRLMVGRDVEPTTRGPINRVVDGLPKSDPVLSVNGLTRFGAFHDVTFSVFGSEVVGIAGLVGAGRSEVARAVFGIDPYDAGTVFMNGQPLPANDPLASVDRGIGFVPEDRQHQGLVLPMSIQSNVSFAALRRLTRFGLVQDQLERDTVHGLTEELQVKMTDPNAAAQTLSGGNQQKLVLAKWLATDPCLLMLDEPTRGVDVGAKSQVHRFIRTLASHGMATLVISSELPELLALCDRLLVMKEGRIVDQFIAADVTEDQVLEAALPTSELKN